MIENFKQIGSDNDDVQISDMIFNVTESTFGDPGDEYKTWQIVVFSAYTSGLAHGMVVSDNAFDSREQGLEFLKRLREIKTIMKLGDF